MGDVLVCVDWDSYTTHACHHHLPAILPATRKSGGRTCMCTPLFLGEGRIHTLLGGHTQETVSISYRLGQEDGG